MNDIFKMVLSLSLSGTVTILGIFLLCRIFRKRISRRWQYYIWLAAAARLLVPFSGEINLVGHVFAQAERYAEQTEVSDAGRMPDPGRALSEKEGSADVSKEQTAESVSGTDHTGQESGGTVSGSAGIEGEGGRAEPAAVRGYGAGKQILGAAKSLAWHPEVVWLTAAALLLIQKIAAYRRFVRSVRAGSEPADLELLESFGRIAEEMQLKGTAELYVNVQVSSPLLAGWLRPMVILPAKEPAGKELRYTLLHELTHYRRKDILYKWLIQLVVCLHWFNPFVWLLRREVDRACELACDEAVLEKLAAEERRAYGDMLLHAAGRNGIWSHSVGAVTLHESGKLLKGRLEAILEYRKEARWVKVLSLVLAVLIAGGSAALGAYAGPGTADTFGGEGQKTGSGESEGEGEGSFGEEKDELHFTEGGNDFLLSDGTRVIERDEVFYILCDAVEEEKLPLADAVDGIMLMVVHHDSHASVTLSTSIILSEDRSGLQKEAETVCEDMVRRGTLSEEDAARIVETAGELQKRDRQEPSHVFYEGSYYQSAYYQAPYLFFVGYDLTEEAAGQYAGKEILLADGEELRVCFTDAEQRWMEEEGFLEALSELFSELRSRTGKRVSEIRRPIISSVEVVGYDAEGLTEDYYAKSDWGCFSVLIAELAADRQREYLEKAFQEEDMAVLPIILDTLYRNDRLSDEQIDPYLTRAFENGEIAPFAVLTEYMSRELLQKWYAKLGGGAGGSSYSYILRDRLNDDEEESQEEEVWDGPEEIWNDW